MDIEITGTVAALAMKSFEGKDGETVEYTEVYIQYEDEDGNLSVAHVNTKKEMKDYIGEKGKFKININEQGKKKLVSFTQ